MVSSDQIFQIKDNYDRISFHKNEVMEFQNYLVSYDEGPSTSLTLIFIFKRITAVQTSSS